MLVGGCGQLGQTFKPALDYIYGEENVLVTDVHQTHDLANYKFLNAIDYLDYKTVASTFQPSLILHLPALLSGTLKSNM